MVLHANVWNSEKEDMVWRPGSLLGILNPKWLVSSGWMSDAIDTIRIF